MSESNFPVPSYAYVTEFGSLSQDNTESQADSLADSKDYLIAYAVLAKKMNFP